MASSLTKDAAKQENTSPASGGKTFFGHPFGLAPLFMTEMWERFSYYGMRALLVVYLIAGGPDAKPGSQGGGLAMPEASSVAIYSVYVAMVYLLAMPGGWFGDRVWGPRKTVTIAASTIMVGHLALAIPGKPTFFVGLALVALGSGLLKSNISTMVGHLYDGPEDPRRDGGFTVFYMGINLGAFFSPLVIGTIGQKYNWHLGFTIAAVGMAIGLAFFLWGTRHLNPKSSIVPKPLSAAEKKSTLTKGLIWLAVAAVFYGIVGGTGHFTLNWALVPITIAGLIIPISVLVRIKRDKELSASEQTRVSGYIWFFVAAAVFWMIFDQAGSTMSTFAEKKTADNVFGINFPSTWFQSVNPLWVMALAPVFAFAWMALARRNREPSTTVKFAMAMVVIGASFFVFAVPMGMASDGTKVSPAWLLAIYMIQTMGELSLSPVGLSLTTKMAPQKYASQMMGVWFLAVTAGDCTTGLLSIAKVDLDGTNVILLQAALAALAGVAVWMYRKKIEGLMGNIR
ncbi:POT family proton-dependent oligopeptide transporter [Streptomyces olivoverticillatus]|uniref:POT family proton-dependent oligopeptide transporter n=1 Tax=Streptomyces olivoverticillatus TaxID=66427 RepID=A0A7W7PMU6_9ACTN|nr:oligopeptide:H+ symporter [Streptomyces olivoverticillatus]MBB4894828.1 POT family proton-dependent oligopeptide transporter [Streptomyces olivoverticillatus]